MVIAEDFEPQRWKDERRERRHDFSVTVKALFRYNNVHTKNHNGHFFLLRIVNMAASTKELLCTRPFHAYKHACMHARARNRPSLLPLRGCDRAAACLCLFLRAWSGRG